MSNKCSLNNAVNKRFVNKTSSPPIFTKDLSIKVNNPVAGIQQKGIANSNSEWHIDNPRSGSELVPCRLVMAITRTNEMATSYYDEDICPKMIKKFQTDCREKSIQQTIQLKAQTYSITA